MREINVEEIITNIKEMCIEANHFLSDDMKNILVTSEQNEKSSHITSDVVADDNLLESEDIPELTSQNTEESVTPVSAPTIERHVEAPVQEKKEKSTLDLLEERNHADAVRRAQRAGVSTEGTTMEILERINHADVVKRAQRAGVSTEGSTMDILERINRKELEGDQ